MAVKAITSLEEFKTTTNSDTLVLIDFWAEWCGPCKVISPVFEGHANKPEYSNVKFYKVDVDSQSDIAAKAGVRAMPTFQLYKNGVKLDELVGAVPQKLEALVEKAQLESFSSTSVPTDSDAPSNEDPDKRSA